MAEFNLRSTINKDGSVTANWDSIPGAAKYFGELKLYNSQTPEYINYGLRTTTFTTKAGLAAGKRYEIRVIAYDSNSKAFQSKTIGFTFPSDFYQNQPVAVPQNVKAVADTVSVTVSFSEVKYATSYDILFDNTVYNVKTTSRKFTGLGAKTSHTYAVRAKNTNYTSAYSTKQTISTKPFTPAVPSGITKTATETSVTISWGKVTNATGYDIQFDGRTYSVTGTSKTFSSLTAGKTYNYQIRSKNADAASAYTSVLAVTTAPKPPATINATSTESSITISWNAVTGAKTYMVKFDGTPILTMQTSYTASGLKPNTSHTYQVCARSADGEGSYSTQRTIKTKLKLADPPGGVKKASTDTSATVSWNAVTGAKGYDVRFNNSVYAVTGTSKTFTGLTPNTDYKYQVRTKDANGAGEYGAEQTVRTTPKAPTAVTVTANENSMTLSWGAVAGATGYDVLFNGTVYPVTGTSKTFTGLSANVGYTYQVRVKNADGASTYCTSKSTKTAPIPPSVPTARATTNSVTLSWNSVSGATSYDLLFNKDTYRVTGTSKTVTGLVPGTSYTYAVRSNNAGGSSSYSSTKTITTIPNPPAMPANISTSVRSDSVTVSWGTVTGAKDYDLYFDGKTYNTTGLSRTMTGLSPNCGYSYRVRANNEGGSSSYSSMKTVWTLKLPPAVPTGMRASVTTNSVSLAWNSVSGAESYDLLFNGKIYEVEGTQKLISGLAPNTGYSYQVRAKNNGGMSAYSAVQTVRTQMLPPAVPAGISAVPTTNSVTIRWGAVSGAASYDVSFNGKTYRATTNSQVISGLTPNTRYNYAVRANNAGGSSAYSAVQTVLTNAVPPTMPTSVRASATADTVTIEWNAVEVAESYDILWNNAMFNTEGTSWTHSHLNVNTDYRYAVRARNRAGTSLYSETQTIRTMLHAPLNVRATATTDSVTVSWNVAEGATGYDIKFNGTVYSVKETSRTFTGLEDEKEYTYAVCAKNDVVYSEYSNKASIMTLSAAPPVPTNVRAESTFNSVRVSWDSVEGAESYEVEFDGILHSVPGAAAGKMRIARKMRAARADSQGNNYIFFHNLRPNTQHTYCVRSRNSRKASKYSPLGYIRTKLFKPRRLPNVKSGGRYQRYLNGRIGHVGLDPVNALTGAFLWSYTCLEDYGKDGLHFTVMYDSRRDEYPKALGRKWTYSLNYLLYMDDEYAYFSTPYDEVAAFAMDGEKSSFTPAEGVQSDYAMGRKEDGAYFVKDVEGTEYVFDSNLCLKEIVEGGLVAYRFRADEKGQITHIEGRHGKTIVLCYENGHVANAADGAGNTAAFGYEGDLLVSITNPGGGSMGFAYDDEGNLLEITDFSGKNYLSCRYDAFGRVIEQNTAGRGKSYAAYDEEGRTTVFADELGNQTKYSYDENGCVTGIEQGGSGIRSTYDENGRLTEQTDGLGNVTKMAYDEYGRMNRAIYPDGTEEQVFFNERNCPVRMVNRDGSESIYEYDERNNLLTARDERGNACSYSYDEEDNLVSYTDKEGNAWTYGYDENGYIERAEDPEGNIYTYVHDAIGRLISYTTPAGRTTTYQYGGTGDLLHIEDGDGTVTFAYDENGNQTRITDRMGNSRRMEYDGMGQVALATDFMGNVYTFAYDARGELVKETDPLGFHQDYSYDAFGNCTAWTDKNGGTTTYRFDAASQLTEVKDAAGGLTRYAYDTVGRVKTVTDALDHQTSYDYDAVGRIVGVTDALGNSVSYTYDKNGNLLTKTDEEGTVISYTYDKENRISSIETDLGTTRFIYDKLGRVVSVEDTDGHVETAEYDGDGNSTAFTDKESQSTVYAYDASGRLAEETRPDGGKTSYEYNSNGNCTKITDPEGNAYTCEYDANGRVTKETDPLGYETAYEYDACGNLLSVTDARGGKTFFAYDGNGNRIKVTDPLEGETVYTYDGMNRLTGSTDAEGHSCTYEYDVNGNRTAYTDANGNRWSYEYDALNRLSGVKDGNDGSLAFTYTKTGKIASVTDQEGAETVYRYDSMGRLTQISDALENSLSFTYDSQGRVLAQTDANGNTTAYTYSPSGNLLDVTDPEGGVVSYTYDALGRVLTQTNALGGVTSYEYDGLGHVTAMTDALGNKTVFTYTANGKIASVTDADGGTTSYQYDGCGNLIAVTDPLGNVTAFAYDAMNNQIRECLSGGEEQTCITLYRYDKQGRMVKEINPLLDEKTYGYDGNGNVVSILDEDGNETTVRYDLNNRPLGMCYSDGREAFFRYNKRGELVEMQDWNGTAVMEYGRTGRLRKTTDHNGYTVGYEYDANGNITGITYPDGSVASYAFDKNNRMVKAEDAEGRAATYQYDPMGNIASIRLPGSVSSYTYNKQGLPVKAAYQFDDGTLMEESYSYDVMGRIVGTERTGNVPDLPTGAAYAYDALGRLTSWTEGSKAEAYGYDALGNRTAKSVDGTAVASCQYNGMNQLVKRTENGIDYHYGYDRRGNLTEERMGEAVIRRYLYDSAGYLSRGENLESGETTEYGYNALYMGVKKRRGSIGSLPEGRTGSAAAERNYAVDFLSGTNRVLAAYEEGRGVLRSVYGPGYGCVSRKPIPEPELPETALPGTDLPGAAYFQPDIRGSELFAADGLGGILQYAGGDVWGRRKEEEESGGSGLQGQLRYTSYSFDPVIGKYFAQARFYDAEQGRMMGKDPVKRGLNGYPYCDNDPVNYVDPTGEIANIIAGGIAGGVIGGAFGFAGSAVSQLMSGERFSMRKALGSAANGAVVGAVRGALVGSGIGIGTSLAANFIGGAVGSALEQKIGSGSVSLKESLVGGATNAVSGAIYGDGPLKGFGDALWKGAASGAATAGIRYLARDWDEGGSDLAGSVLGLAQGIGQMAISPYAKNRDPRRGCGVRSPLSNRVGEAMAYGYRYDVGSLQKTGGVRRKKDGFSMLGLLKEAAVGGVMGGLAGTAFYGAGKAFGFLKDSIRDVRGKGGIAPATRPTHGQGFSDKGYNPKPGERTFDRYVNENVPRDVETKLYTNSSGFNTNPRNDGHFKRFGTEPNQHGIEGPHVHQPTRNINPNNGIVTGKPGSKTKNGGVTVPEAKDIKQLYEYLINGKYRKG